MKKISQRNLNLLDTKSGKLLAIKIVKIEKANYFKCLCDCGNYKNIRISAFSSKSTKSCGCLPRYKNLIGKVFGDLKVLNREPSIKSGTRWLCRCKCGNEKIFPSNKLSSGLRKSCGCKNPAARKKVNDFYWSTLNLENCYWAGFLAADGCITRNSKVIKLTISSKDHKHLELFKQNIGFGGDIKKYSRTSNLNNKKYEASNIWITSEKMTNDLKKYFNIIKKKSLILTPPNLYNYNDKLSFAFIKGYIDGDGCISVHKNRNTNIISISVAGTYSVLCWIKNKFEKILGNKIKNKIRKTGNIYQLQIRGKKAVSLISFLKKINTPELERKWSKLDKYLE
jgi:hypothetical protein